MTRNALIIFAVACALPLAALAQEPAMPRMLKGMAKGQWRMDILENSQAKPGQKMPSMTMCTDNLAKDMREARDKSAAKSESQCKHRLIRDGADDAVWEISCPKRTVTTAMKREGANSVLMEMKTTGDKPHTMKMRYTHLGPCREGQGAISYDKNSPECRKIEAAAAKMDPAKSCANSGDKRAQCEKMLRDQVAQMKAMCG